MPSGIYKHKKESIRKMVETRMKKGNYKMSDKVKEKLKEYVGEKHSNWKGDNVSYKGLHLWVRKALGKPSKCEHCGKNGLINSKNTFTIDWANKDHKYRRVKEGWIRLCKKCHHAYDAKHNNKVSFGRNSKTKAKHESKTQKGIKG